MFLKGFSVLEVLVATFIFSVVAMGIVDSQLWQWQVWHHMLSQMPALHAKHIKASS